MITNIDTYNNGVAVVHFPSLWTWFQGAVAGHPIVFFPKVWYVCLLVIMQVICGQYMLWLCYLLSAEGSKDATLALVTPIPENNSWIQIQYLPFLCPWELFAFYLRKGYVRASDNDDLVCFKSFGHSYLCTHESPDFLVPPSQVAAAKQNLERVKNLFSSWLLVYPCDLVIELLVSSPF